MVAPPRVAAIGSGTGYVDMASDVEQLGVLFDEAWNDVTEDAPPVSARA